MKSRYIEELKKLRRTKPKTCLPFVFADPRRIKDDTTYFAEIKNCIVNEEFRGIKNLTDHIVQEPTTMPWGNRSLLFCDPDGNLINFFTPVSPEAIQKFR